MYEDRVGARIYTFDRKNKGEWQQLLPNNVTEMPRWEEIDFLDWT